MRILGYRKFVSKSGANCLIASVVSELSDRDKLNGGVGEKCEDLFIPESEHAKFTPACIGKEIVINYNVSGTRAFINTITIK